MTIVASLVVLVWVFTRVGGQDIAPSGATATPIALATTAAPVATAAGNIAPPAGQAPVAAAPAAGAATGGVAPGAGAQVQAGAPAGSNATVVAGPPKLTATFNSIGVELPFRGDTNGSATAGLEFRRAGERDWRAGLPLWRTADPSGPAFYGSALLLEPGTTYEVRVTVDDGDGVQGSAQQSATIDTRADTIAPPEALSPTHYVRVVGDDAADGRSPDTAWRTIEKVIRDAPPGATVQVGPGFYSLPNLVPGRVNPPRTAPLTLVAEVPAVNADRQTAAPGKRSVLEPAGVSSPRGAADGPNPGVWEQAKLAGPKTGRTYTVWKWAGSPVGDATQLGYAGSRTDTPVRVARWQKDQADLATPAGWAEKLYTNLTYNYGFFADGPDIFLRLPGDRDPNREYITASGANQAGFAIDGPDIRLCGFEIRQFTSGVDVLTRARSAVVDRNLITGNAIGVAFRGERGNPDANGVRPSFYGSDHVVQENLILDSSLRSNGATDLPEGSMIPWMFIKTKIREADGSEYASARVGGPSESSGVGGRGSAQRVVVRRNTVDGPLNGVGTGYNEGFDRYAGQDMDIYDNVIQHVGDDALEPESATINFRAWNNRIQESLTVRSTGPVNFGPVYLFRNAALQIGNDGMAPDGQGREPGSTMLKYSGKSNPPARIYVLHNTFWTDHLADGGAQYASTGSSPEAFYLRNNLIRATRYAFEAPKAAGAWDEDSNYLVTTDPGRGLSFNGVTYRENVQAYREASGRGARTNVASGFGADVQLADPAAGDVRLPADSPLVDAGVPLPNLSDRAGVDFQGAAPDIGHEER